jgi:hypothetical protein
MDLKKKLEQIDEHFKNISKAELEANLKKAGLRVIKPCSKSNAKML